MQAQFGAQPSECARANMTVNVWSHKKATQSTLTASLYTWAVCAREGTQEGSVTATLMPANGMVSRVTRELSALIFLHQLIPVDMNVDHVHQGTQEMERSV